MAAINATDVSR